MAEHSHDARNNSPNEADRLDEEHGQEKGFENVRDMKPHESVGFWHHKMSKVRKHVIQLWARTGKLRSRAACKAHPFLWARPASR